MDKKYSEALSEFFDGEEVDAALLAESPAQPGAITLLNDFAVMRTKAQSGPRPSPEVLDAIGATVEQAAHRHRWGSRLGRLAAAACLLLIAAGVGVTLAPVFEHARRVAPQAPVQQRPPASIAQQPPAAAPPQPTPAVPPPGSRQSSRRDADHPPIASLRIRLGQQWAETFAGAGSEAPRH
jgi:hypothetical protein